MHSLRVHFLLILFFLAFSAQAADLTSEKYDRQFRQYSGMYMPGRDWKLLKAQCYQESRFVENAVSPVGAMGLCQFMPRTWQDTESQTGLKGNPFNPHLNVQFSAYYMSKLRRIWTAPRPQMDRESLAIASYNAGAGNLLKAQKKCGNKSTWGEISPCIKLVTGAKNSHETLTYVERIWMYFRRLGGIAL